MSYKTVIGLEIHAELLTKSKVFCSCIAEFGGEENTRVCPRCSGFPGTLPVLNKDAVRLAVKAGLALECDINKYNTFDRKNYFYPDLPKSYQITQFDKPICTNGMVVVGDKIVRINRIHIEEDAGKLVHDEKNNVSLADYNRSGVPLIEIVTDPEITSAQEAKDFVKEVALRLKYADVCDAKMEQGSLRCDVNISIMPQDTVVLGTRTEIKNLNSLKSIVRAIEYEYQRQCDLVESGQQVIQQTLHFDEVNGITKPMRTKDEARDYRYFPEPDIPPVLLSEIDIEDIKSSMPEMPADRLKRYIETYELSQTDAKLLVSDKELSDFYNESVKIYPAYKQISNMILVELLSILNDFGKSFSGLILTPQNFADLIKLVEEGVVSKTAAKEILRIMFDNGESPSDIANRHGYIMVTDTSEVDAAIDIILSENEKAVNDFKEGSQKVLGFFMGQICKKLGNSANPQIVRERLNNKIKSR